MNIPITTDPDTIRKDIEKLCDKRARGDVDDKSFQRAWTERIVDLFRAVAGRKLSRDESILQEHHVIQAHFKVTQTFLKEPEQLATSLFATSRRLIRVRTMVRPGTPVQCDKNDQTAIDDIPFNTISSLKVRRQVRSGEALAGAVIAVFAFASRSWLEVTGLFMCGLGLAGVVHGLLLPTRWIEVQTSNLQSRKDPFMIYALRKKSARRLVRFLHERIGR